MSAAWLLFFSPFRSRNRSTVAVEHPTENELDAVMKALDAKRIETTAIPVTRKGSAVKEIREISVGASVDRKVVLDIAIDGDDGVCTMVSKRMDISFAELLQRKLDVAIKLATEGRESLLMKSLIDAGYVGQQDESAPREQSASPDPLLVGRGIDGRLQIKEQSHPEGTEQQNQPVTDIGDDLREAINDLGKSAVLRGKMPIESNIHFMGAIRRLRNLQEQQFPISCGGGLCYEARDTLEIADKLHRTLAGGN
jgi:hypothetical protein